VLGAALPRPQRQMASQPDIPSFVLPDNYVSPSWPSLGMGTQLYLLSGAHVAQGVHPPVCLRVPACACACGCLCGGRSFSLCVCVWLSVCAAACSIQRTCLCSLPPLQTCGCL
jgi:hypothetical protein